MGQPLSDIKVLDLTENIAGPYCTKLLADYGADVLKVEKPGFGDSARRLGPFLNDEAHPEKSGLFLHLNTNKRSITLNIACETGARIFQDLVKRVDILVESFPPKVMPSLGLDYETLEKINTKLVMTSISDFGQTGPYRDFKGSELIYQGAGGTMYAMGLPERKPMKKAGNVIQYEIGYVAAIATMMALYGADIRGYGDHVDIDGVRVDLTSIEKKSHMMVGHQYTGSIYRRQEQAGVRMYPCQDGYVGILFLPVLFPRLVRLLELTPEEIEEWGKPEVVTDPVKLGEFDEKFLTVWLLTHTMAEIVEAGQKAGLPMTPYHNAEGVLNDPHFKERGTFVEIDHPVAGRLTYPGATFRMGEGGWQIRRPAPLLGQHNEEVYGELGYSKQDLVILMETKVI